MMSSVPGQGVANGTAAINGYPDLPTLDDVYTLGKIASGA
jgi:hypothetical protein